MSSLRSAIFWGVWNADRSKIKLGATFQVLLAFGSVVMATYEGNSSEG